MKNWNESESLTEGANVDHPEEFTHISLCAGYGGIDLGLKRVIPSLRTIAFSEIEAYAVANLVAKIEAGFLDAAPIWSDLKTFPFRSFRGKVDLISGGFPCQPFSAAGRRQGDEDSRHLWPHIVRGIRESSPRVVFFENVEGIISSKLKSNEWSDREGTPVLLHVLRELERLGYRATAGVFSAAEVGAPHQRKRVFILGEKLDHTKRDRLQGSIVKSRCSTATSEEELCTTSGDSTSYTLYPSRKGEELSNTNNSGYDNSSSCETNSYGAENIEKRSEFSFSQFSRYSNTRWPAKRGQAQYSWEPPRVLTMVNANRTRLQREVSEEYTRRPDETNKELSAGSSTHEHLHGQTQSALGGYVDGVTDRLDNAELHESFDNITDELRLLGNGVVPDTAARAFEVLWNRLNETRIH